MEEILKQIGWDKGFRIPVADKQNQALQEELEQLTLRKTKARKDFENAEDRFNALQKHLKFVHQQSEENQRLLTAYRQQIDAEESKYHTLLAEKQSTLGEVRNTEKCIREIDERREVKRSDLGRQLAKIDKIKAEMDWDAEALRAWEESLKKREEDNELIKKFAKEDERKAKELEVRRKNLQTDVNARQELIEKAVADQLNYETVLQRTGQLLKELKTERISLIKQWEEAARNLRRRDTDIEKANIEFESVRKMITDQLEALDEQNKFYNNQKRNNKELEDELSKLNLQSSKMKKELDGLSQDVLTLASEANALKHLLLSTANFLEKERAKGRNANKEISDKEYRILTMETELQNLAKKLNDVKNSSMSSAERVKELEAMIEEEQEQANILIQDMSRIQSQFYRSQQTITNYKDEVKRKEFEISGIHSSLGALRREAQNEYNSLQKKKETVYEVDFKINRLEGRLAKLEGDINKSDDDAIQQQEKVDKLEHNLAEQKELKHLLQSQVTVIEDEMRRLTKSLSADGSQMEILKEKLQEQITLYEVGKKQLVAAGELSRKKRVDQNMLRLQVDHLEKSANREDGLICDVKRYRLELETAMNERLIEVNTDKEILQVKRRNLNEEKSRLKCDIMGRHIKIDHLQKKYQVTIMSLGTDEDGKPLSVTHFKIKKAQEKYMLQQEGDELDNKVRKAEKEIIAMENTLKVVNVANVAFRNSMSAIDEEGEEAQELKELEKDIHNLDKIFHQTRRLLNKKKQHLEGLKDTLNSMEVQRDEQKESVRVLVEEYCTLTHVAEEREQKLKRADRNLRSVMQRLDISKIEKYSKNLLIRHLQDANKSALRQLSDIAAQFQETHSKISCYLDGYGLQLPNRYFAVPPELDTSSQDTDSTRSAFPSKSKESTTTVSSDVPTVTNVMLTFDRGALCPMMCQCHRRKGIPKKGKVAIKSSSKSSRDFYF